MFGEMRKAREKKDWAVAFLVFFLCLSNPATVYPIRKKQREKQRKINGVESGLKLGRSGNGSPRSRGETEKNQRLKESQPAVQPQFASRRIRTRLVV